MLLVVLGGMGWQGVSEVARACSFAAPDPNAKAVLLKERRVWPGALVPTNVQPLVTYQLGVSSLSPDSIGLGRDLALLDPDGKPVSITTEITVAVGAAEVRVRPLAPLLPGRQYQLLDRRDIPCGDGCPERGEGRAFAIFSTGAGPDTTPPLFAGLDYIAASAWTPNSCDTSFAGVSVALIWWAAHDDFDRENVRYTVYRRDGRGGPWVVEARGLEQPGWHGRISCPRTLGSTTYRVTAVDAVGNEDGNAVELTFDDPCHPPEGVIRALTASGPLPQPENVPPVAPAPPGEVSGGCAVIGPARASASSAVLVLFGLAALGVRRRRR